jgi:hypothetical protein
MNMNINIKIVIVPWTIYDIYLCLKLKLYSYNQSNICNSDDFFFPHLSYHLHCLGGDFWPPLLILVGVTIHYCYTYRNSDSCPKYWMQILFYEKCVQVNLSRTIFLFFFKKYISQFSIWKLGGIHIPHH